MESLTQMKLNHERQFNELRNANERMEKKLTRIDENVNNLNQNFSKMESMLSLFLQKLEKKTDFKVDSSSSISQKMGNRLLTFNKRRRDEDKRKNRRS